MAWACGAQRQPAQETEYVIGVGAVHEAAEEIVAARDAYARGRLGFGQTLIQIVAQRARHDLVGVDYQNIVVRGVLQGEHSRGLHACMFCLGKCHDAAAVAQGDFDRRVVALHVAHQHFVENTPPHGFQGGFYAIGRVAGVDDDCNFSVRHMRYRFLSSSGIIPSQNRRMRGFDQLWQPMGKCLPVRR